MPVDGSGGGARRARGRRPRGGRARLQERDERLRSRPGLAPGDEDRVPGVHGGEIRSRNAERSGRPDAPRLQVDRDDSRRRRAGRRATTTDHVGDRPDRRRGRVRRRLRKRSHSPDLAGARIEREHGRAGGAVCERAAGDHDGAPDRRDGRVANGEREVGDDTCGRSRLPGHDRVEPARAGVATDHVGGASDRGCGAVGARGGQRPCCPRRARREVDARDGRELADGVAPSEDVDPPAEADAGGVVERVRQAPERATVSAADDDRLVEREIGGAEACEHCDATSGEPDRGGVLDGERQAAGRVLHELRRAPDRRLGRRLDPHARPRARGLRPGSVGGGATARRHRPDHRTHDEHEDRCDSPHGVLAPTRDPRATIRRPVGPFVHVE